ncbi:MAG: acetyl-CoA carboxylase carboxyltransferase subunit alpha [Oscillospiraceae bacterium]|nr:acetyl-CoA carboxylase carboxyltransferase subunit alpha [Oscillospiraceae bacterium]
MVTDTENLNKEMTPTEKKAEERRAREKRVKELRERKAREKAAQEKQKQESAGKEKTPYELVRGARSKNRLTSLDFIKGLFRGFIELHGDRRFADDPAVIAGVAYLGDTPFTVIGTEKGRDTKSRIKHNFGTPNPEGYRKSLRLMKQAEKFKRPVICFVDTSGAFCGIGAEERGQGQAIAENIMELMTLKTPVLSILIGEGGSGGALALAVADEVWMFENAVYSVISPEGCANILWREPEKADEAAQNLKLTSKNISDLGVVDRVIPEKSRDPEKMLHDLSAQIIEWYKNTSEIPVDELTQRRYERFRKLGV